MQKSSIEDIRMFLNGEGWSFDGAKSNQSFQYFKYPLSYNIVQWEKSSYSNGGKIILYNYQSKPNIVIYQSNSTCFKELLNSFSSTSKGFTKIDDDILTTFYKENYITIEFREYKNDYSSKQYSILVYNSSALEQEIQIEKNREEAIEKANKEKKIKYQAALSEGDKLFTLEKFDEAKIQYEIAGQIDYTEYVVNKLNICNQLICDKILAQGNLQYENGNFQNAIDLYIQAKSCSKSQSVIENKISLAKKKILEKEINEKLNTGDLYFKENKYDLAIDAYNAVLALDPINIIALDRIKSINNIKDILEKRKTTIFSYKKINEYEFTSFRTNLLKDINSSVNKLNDGFLTFEFRIAFDTIGNNLSSYEISNSSIKDFNAYLSEMTHNNLLKPSNQSGYFLASKENINIDIKWSTEKISYKSSANGIYTVGLSNIGKSVFENYISNQNYKYGKFTFEVKTKSINNNSFSDINLVNYRTSAGPACVLYSMLMPGMGTLKVTYGKKGWGRFACFLISSGIALGSKLYSDGQYKNYLSATDQSSIDKYYNNANISHKIALISGGVSASIYLYDIIWVLSKGIKNQKESKYIKKQLQNGPIQIQTQPITLE